MPLIDLILTYRLLTTPSPTPPTSRPTSPTSPTSPPPKITFTPSKNSTLHPPQNAKSRPRRHSANSSSSTSSKSSAAKSSSTDFEFLFPSQWTKKPRSENSHRRTRSYSHVDEMRGGDEKNGEVGLDGSAEKWGVDEKGTRRRSGESVRSEKEMEGNDWDEKRELRGR